MAHCSQHKGRRLCLSIGRTKQHPRAQETVRRSRTTDRWALHLEINPPCQKRPRAAIMQQNLGFSGTSHSADSPGSTDESLLVLLGSDLRNRLDTRRHSSGELRPQVSGPEQVRRVGSLAAALCVCACVCVVVEVEGSRVSSSSGAAARRACRPSPEPRRSRPP